MSRLFIEHEKYSRILSKDQLANIVSCINDILSSDHFDEVSMWHITKELEMKDSFGDIDVIIQLPDNKQYKQTFVNKLKEISEEVSVNDRVISTLYGPFGKNGVHYHIDYIVTTTQKEFDNSCYYHANGVVMNFIGQFLLRQEIQFGWDGVYYLHHNSNGDVYKLLFCDELKYFFDCYFSSQYPWQMSFNSFDDIIVYLENLYVFPGPHAYSEIHSTDKKRAMKRHNLANEIYQQLIQSKITHDDYKIELNEEHKLFLGQKVYEHEQMCLLNREKKKIKVQIDQFAKSLSLPDQHRKELFDILRPFLYRVNNLSDSQGT